MVPGPTDSQAQSDRSSAINTSTLCISVPLHPLSTHRNTLTVKRVLTHLWYSQASYYWAIIVSHRSTLRHLPIFPSEPPCQTRGHRSGSLESSSSKHRLGGRRASRTVTPKHPVPKARFASFYQAERNKPHRVCPCLRRDPTEASGYNL